MESRSDLLSDGACCPDAPFPLDSSPFEAPFFACTLVASMPAAFRNRNHFPFTMESMLLKYVLLGNASQTQDVLSALNAHFANNNFSQDAIRLFISNLSFRLAFQASGVEGEALDGDCIASVVQHVQELNELDKIMKWFEDYCLRLCENNNANYDSQYRALTAQVDDYILSHYGD